MSRWQWAILAFALACASSARASAQDLVVVALGGDATEPQRAQALDVAVARFAADGFAVLAPSELVHRVPPSRLSLASTEDAARLASELGVPRVACVSVWATDGAIGELSLSLHALAGGRSVRHGSASGTLAAGADLVSTIDSMVSQVLAAERAAAMLDPGAGAIAPSAPASASTPASTSTPAPPSTSVTAPFRATDPSRSSARGPEPLFGVLGPGLLAAIGAAAAGLGVWASLDTVCERYNVDRTVCLRGEEQNLAAGIPMILGGAVALAGAVVWWITGAQAPESEPRIDVVLGPGSAGVRGTF
jgi:hypothetical protein